MVDDPGPIVRGAMLRAELLRLRQDRHLTQQTVARALDWHPSKLIRIEGGKSRITKTDLQALLREYRVNSESRQERLEALREDAAKRAWWDEYRDVVSDTTIRYAGYESGATTIRQFENAVIPGLLQTPEYARAIFTHYVGEHEIDRRIEARMRRREELARRQAPPREFFILDEAAIRRHIGAATDPRIMPRQLRRINELSETDDRLTVRVVPFSAGAHPGLEGPFALLEFDGGAADVLYLEGPSAVQTQSTLEDRDDTVAEYRASFESIAESSLSADESLTLIGKVADEFESDG